MLLKKNPTHDLRLRPHKVEKLSPTGLKSYLSCGLQWRLSHVDELEFAKPNLNLVFGSVFHKGLEPYWRGGQPAFQKYWSRFQDIPALAEQYKGRMDWAAWAQRGQDMVNKIMSATYGYFDPKTTRVEIKEEVDLGFVVLNRRIDVLTVAEKLPMLLNLGDQVKFSGPAVFDLKSAGRMYGLDAAQRSPQLLSYMIPNPKADYERPKMAAFIVATKAIEPRVMLIGHKYGKAEVKNQVQTFKLAADNIRRGVFPQVKGDHCGYCDFRQMCYEQPGWEGAYRVSRYRSRANATNSRPIDLSQGTSKATGRLSHQIQVEEDDA